MVDGADAELVVDRPQFRCQQYVFELSGDPGLVERLTKLFVDLETSPVATPHRWDIERFRAHARISVDGAAPSEWVWVDFLGAATISALTMAVIGAESTMLHLHAAAVVDDDRTVVLVGPSGSGKSTLTCALVAAGAGYRTDEAIAVHSAGRRITTYPKPISVKESGAATVEQLTGLTRPPSGDSWEIPVSSFGAVAPNGDHPVTTFVSNSYGESLPTVIEPLHRATAVYLALSDSQDASAIGPGSLWIAARLVTSAQCLRVTGSDAREAARAVLDAHRLPFEPGVLERVPSPLHHAGPARAPSVTSVVIDGRAVLFTHEPQHVIELDETQTFWWLIFDGTPIDQTVDEIAFETGRSRDEVVDTAHAAIGILGSLGVLAVD